MPGRNAPVSVAAKKCRSVSKAFTKEDDATPERTTRTRSASGLPPGAVNYMTAEGARQLRMELVKVSVAGSERASDIERILATATIVEAPAEPPPDAVFGARVSVRDSDGSIKSFRVVGVDEVYLEPDSVSWTSPIGRALLGAEPGQRVALDVDGEIRKCTVISINY